MAVKEGNIDLVDYLLRISLPKMKEFVNMKVSSTPRRLSELQFTSAHDKFVYVNSPRQKKSTIIISHC